MFAARVVEVVDVFEEGDLEITSYQSRRQTSPAFRGLKKLLTAVVVKTITLAAHRHFETMAARKLLVFVSAVLRAAIGDMNAT